MLLPCPFCGATPVLEESGCDKCGKYWSIRCSNDGVCQAVPWVQAIGWAMRDEPPETRDDAIRYWNTRHDDDTGPDPITSVGQCVDFTVAERGEGDVHGGQAPAAP